MQINAFNGQNNQESENPTGAMREMGNESISSQGIPTSASGEKIISQRNGRVKKLYIIWYRLQKKLQYLEKVREL
jgi:hypothetical protein